MEDQNKNKQEMKLRLDQESLDFFEQKLKDSFKDGVRLVGELKALISIENGLMRALADERKLLMERIILDKVEKQENETLIANAEKLLKIVKKIDFSITNDDFKPEYSKYLELNKNRYNRSKDRLIEFCKPKSNPSYAIYLWPVIEKIRDIIEAFQRIQMALPLKLYYEQKVAMDRGESNIAVY